MRFFNGHRWAALLALASAGCMSATAPVEGALETMASAATSTLPGSLDTTFGSGGTVTTPVVVRGGVRAVLQSDGKILVACTVQDPNTGAPAIFGVVRYLLSGTLDSSFGQGGVVRTPIGVDAADVSGFALTTDGKIIVVGTDTFQVVSSSGQTQVDAFLVVRYTSSGALDSTFGQGGELKTSVLGKSDRAQVVLVQGDGKILVGGTSVAPRVTGAYSPGHDLALVRYQANGALDPVFGQNGIISSGVIGFVAALALESDGSILVADSGAPPKVVRFDASGAQVPLALNGSLVASSPAVFGGQTFQTDGKLLVAAGVRGITRRTSIIQMQRYALDGTVDPTFNSPAFSFAPQIANTSTSGQGLLVESNGRIVVVGIAPIPNSATAFGVAALDGDGSLDTAFGSGGTLTTQFSGRDQASAVLGRSDGKIVVVGETGDSNGNESIAIAQYFGP